MAIDTTNQITVEFTPLDTFQSTDILTLAGGTTAAYNRLDHLDDVVEPTLVANNMTLVYNSDTDKYTVQELNLDGGTF
jgi:hypothetical protein